MMAVVFWAPNTVYGYGMRNVPKRIGHVHDRKSNAPKDKGNAPDRKGDEPDI
jgi:hypothetical protein